MNRKLGRARILKACLISVLFLSIFPEVVFSQEDTRDKVEMDVASSEGANSCDEHNCPVLPDEPFHHCAVCCAISHFFINQFSDINFHFDHTPQSFSMTEDVLYKDLFAKTLFRPPQSIL
ncbi:MAG: hypothetical protein NUV86_02185 [Candidatus Scalindua sp.]|nr:hypothetical protein [Candidatus Scalindua sp.]MCR4344700.1 hypothetical protein [Candidatus Scalindua sp.]